MASKPHAYKYKMPKLAVAHLCVQYYVAKIKSRVTGTDFPVYSVNCKKTKSKMQRIAIVCYTLGKKSEADKARTDIGSSVCMIYKEKPSWLLAGYVRKQNGKNGK